MTGLRLGWMTVTLKVVEPVPPRPSSTETVMLAVPGALAVSAICPICGTDAPTMPPLSLMATGLESGSPSGSEALKLTVTASPRLSDTGAMGSMTGLRLGWMTVTLKVVEPVPPRPSSTETVMLAVPGALAVRAICPICGTDAPTMPPLSLMATGLESGSPSGSEALKLTVTASPRLSDTGAMGSTTGLRLGIGVNVGVFVGVGVTVDVSVGIGVSVSVGVNVGVTVGVSVGIGVSVGVSVKVGVKVGVSVGIGVSVGVSVKVGVSVGIGVSVGVSVKVGVNVGVSVGIGVSVGVSVKVGVNVGVSVGIGVSVGVSVKVGVNVDVSVGIGVSDGVGDAVDVSVEVAVDVGVSVKVGV